jgi:hypothetical protein
MIRVSPRLSRVLLGAVFALSAGVPASAAPSGEVFVKLPPGSTAAQDDKHKNQIEILSYSWGATQTTTTHTGGGMGAGKVKMGSETTDAGGVSVAAGDVNGDGRADLSTPRDSASGLPTGKRQHKPMTMTMELGRGSVSLQLGSAWTDCRVGTQYPELELGDRANGYKLRDAIITSCASDSVTLNYAKKVTVRGWNPEKKEE